MRSARSRVVEPLLTGPGVAGGVLQQGSTVLDVGCGTGWCGPRAVARMRLSSCRRAVFATMAVIVHAGMELSRAGAHHRVSAYLHRKYPQLKLQIEGMDCSENMLEIARVKDPRSSFRHGCECRPLDRAEGVFGA